MLNQTVNDLLQSEISRLKIRNDAYDEMINEMNTNIAQLTRYKEKIESHPGIINLINLNVEGVQEAFQSELNKVLELTDALNKLIAEANQKAEEEALVPDESKFRYGQLQKIKLDDIEEVNIDLSSLESQIEEYRAKIQGKSQGQ